MRGECVRQMAKRKSVVLPLSAVSYYHACEHITRKSRADSCTHCLHARYKCRAGVGGVSVLMGWRAYFFIFDICCTPTLSCRGRRRRRPAKKHKVAFPLSYFCMTKSTKSHIRERSPLLYISSRVHELFARAMRGKCVRQRGKGKISSFTALRNLILPRVRTYHTK